MNHEVLGRLRCPVCSSGLRWRVIEESGSGRVETGAAWCDACHNWYPIEGGVLELLPPGLGYKDDRQRFWAAHKALLEEAGVIPEGTPAGLQEAQRKQQEHFDWYATNQGQTYSSYEQMPFWRETDDMLFAAWKRLVRPGAWVLDVGCAQGRSTFKLMDLPIHLVGFDISKHLVRQALAAYRAGQYAADATFFVGDASALPFAPETFDHVLIYGVLHHLPQPERTCREVVEVLKPGGSYFGSENNRTAFRALFDWLMKLKLIWHEEAGAQPLIGREDFRAWFRNTSVRVETDTHVFVPPHLVNLLGRRWGGRVLRMANAVGRSLPWLRHQGGLIAIQAQKADAPAPATAPATAPAGAPTATA